MQWLHAVGTGSEHLVNHDICFMYCLCIQNWDYKMLCVVHLMNCWYFCKWIEWNVVCSRPYLWWTSRNCFLILLTIWRKYINREAKLREKSEPRFVYLVSLYNSSWHASDTSRPNPCNFQRRGALDERLDKSFYCFSNDFWHFRTDDKVIKILEKLKISIITRSKYYSFYSQRF